MWRVQDALSVSAETSIIEEKETSLRFQAQTTQAHASPLCPTQDCGEGGDCASPASRRPRPALPPLALAPPPRPLLLLPLLPAALGAGPLGMGPTKQAATSHVTGTGLFMVLNLDKFDFPL